MNTTMKWTSHKKGARSRGEWWSQDGRWRLVEVGNTGSGWTKSVHWRFERWNGTEWVPVPSMGRITKLAQAKAMVEELEAAEAAERTVRRAEAT